MWYFGWAWHVWNSPERRRGSLPPFFGSSLTHAYVARKEARNNSITFQNGCAHVLCVCVCVCRVLSVMCNKVSFYRPASTSGQLLVTPEPQSQPQPQKHNSCPSDSCRFSSISPFPPLFQLQLQQRQLKMWPEFCRRRKLKALLWPVAIVRFFGQNRNSCAEVLQLLLPCSCQRRRTKH